MNNLIEISNIYYTKALELIKHNKISQAVDLIHICLKYCAKDVQALNLMGICQYMLCDFDKAYFYWSKSVAFDNENNRANYYLDTLNSDSFKKVIKKYNSAIDNINNFKYKDAISILKEIKKENEELIEPYVILGLCYYELNEYSKAKEHIQYALTMDKDNYKYLLYLNEINCKDVLQNKTHIFKNKIIVSFLFFLLMIISTLYYQRNNNFIDISNRTTEYQKKIQEYSRALDISKTNYNKLISELEYEKEKNDLINADNILHNEDLENNKIFSDNEYEVFNNAIFYFRAKDYSEAIDRFQYIISKGVEENIVAESTYFMAVSYEKSNNYKLAQEYYTIYINNYNTRNYYDDSLYNYGLMLYKQGNVDKSKKILNKLKLDVPDSIFVNSKVKYVLNK
ncbi:tetratricopeptide repeat protein [Natranaerovirga pectinivora]|uniref:Tetratricopeptide repeat protein n=1 Tax=Natranaerovirga pectinivora TaxID=682400 RepID=A0A4R3MNB6_9FIRM|nr:tetratricopeptide repeat protein [Natranaerovirga pectinivora]TCT16000.1 tetratricopeptide repeat protein [Natranaerovirga pectinivora]